MIELEFKGKKHELPTSFSEVPICKYQEIMKINDMELKDMDKYIKTINIITGIGEKDIKSININQLKVINKNLQFLFQNDNVGLIDRFVINGIKYGFNNHLSSISFGEYIDLEEYSKKEEIIENLHIIMAILFRPIKSFKKRTIYSYFKRYKDEDYEIEDYWSIDNKEDNKMKDETIKRSELFKEKLTMDIVNGALVFFSILKATTIYHSRGYSEKKLKKMVKMTKEVMMKEVITG